MPENLIHWTSKPSNQPIFINFDMNRLCAITTSVFSISWIRQYTQHFPGAVILLVLLLLLHFFDFAFVSNFFVYFFLSSFSLHQYAIVFDSIIYYFVFKFIHIRCLCIDIWTMQQYFPIGKFPTNGIII